MNVHKVCKNIFLICISVVPLRTQDIVCDPTSCLSICIIIYKKVSLLFGHHSAKHPSLLKLLLRKVSAKEWSHLKQRSLAIHSLQEERGNPFVKQAENHGKMDGKPSASGKTQSSLVEGRGPGLRATLHRADNLEQTLCEQPRHTSHPTQLKNLHTVGTCWKKLKKQSKFNKQH